MIHTWIKIAIHLIKNMNPSTLVPESSGEVAGTNMDGIAVVPTVPMLIQAQNFKPRVSDWFLRLINAGKTSGILKTL
jgi:hypothetical protein